MAERHSFVVDIANSLIAMENHVSDTTPNRRGRPRFANPSSRQALQIGVRMTPPVLEGIDRLRGSTPRSTFIRNLIEQAVQNR